MSTARYHVLVSDELMETDLPWPHCLHFIEQEPTDPARYPDMHWWLVEDAGASADLNGKRVELTISADYDDHGNIAATSVAGRTVMTWALGAYSLTTTTRPAKASPLAT